MKRAVEDHCSACGTARAQAGTLMRCSCAKALYCDKKCQRADWRAHKQVCSFVNKK